MEATLIKSLSDDWEIVNPDEAPVYPYPYSEFEESICLQLKKYEQVYRLLSAYLGDVNLKTDQINELFKNKVHIPKAKFNQLEEYYKLSSDKYKFLECQYRTIAKIFNKLTLMQSSYKTKLQERNTSLKVAKLETEPEEQVKLSWEIKHIQRFLGFLTFHIVTLKVLKKEFKAQLLKYHGSITSYHKLLT